MHQLRVSYGNKVTMIRDSLANKVTDFKRDQKKDLETK